MTERRKPKTKSWAVMHHEPRHRNKLVLNRVDAQEKLFKCDCTQYWVDAFSAKYDKGHFQSVVQPQPGPANTPFFPTAIRKLEDRGAMRPDAKPFQNGSWNHRVRGTRVDERTEGLEVPAGRIA